MNPLISIIIPVYNRGQLISETLESIANQSYRNLECIVVDDGSVDDTVRVLDFYRNKDKRFQYYKREKDRLKGANSCRNIGFNKSTGDYVVWFDSDDLMTTDHLESKLLTIQASNADFVVAQTANFLDGKLLEPYKYDIMPYGIKASDFILLKIHWYTYDVLLKREVANKLNWNERMNSWQDYNYFCKMLLVTEKGEYVKKVLTHRRLHSNSIQSSLTRNKMVFKTELLENRLFTYYDISEQIDLKTREELIYGMMNLCFNIASVGLFPKKIKEVSTIVKENFGKRSAFIFKVSIVSSLVTKKGFYLLEKSKARKSFSN